MTQFLAGHYFCCLTAVKTLYKVAFCKTTHKFPDAVSTFQKHGDDAERRQEQKPRCHMLSLSSAVSAAMRKTGETSQISQQCSGVTSPHTTRSLSAPATSSR